MLSSANASRQDFTAHFTQCLDRHGSTASAGAGFSDSRCKGPEKGHFRLLGLLARSAKRAIGAIRIA